MYVCTCDGYSLTWFLTKLSKCIESPVWKKHSAAQFQNAPFQFNNKDFIQTVKSLVVANYLSDLKDGVQFHQQENYRANYHYCQTNYTFFKAFEGNLLI